ncbi:putative basic helix-loop-helix domain-containing protein KIAA2018 -like [Scophthalmus maximus]|uniref:Putative basic helix-loop-helix domain-containing protein KIAA2018-like n=1 Tax=Scophthalmus maximus TaxID=52904 RepID=A0A2U9D1F3_SCOMX|nr:putative basic helix-loop-helix domain-containing protein KIAA2018 -like [Scophthalmus maximus]
MPEMTETPTPGRKPKKKKNKESHNAVERHRKEKINAGINLIGDLLPCSQALKQSKNMILDQAFRYITELKKQNDTLLLDGGDKVQAEEIRRLRRQVEELRKESAHYIELLKAHDINILEDPTIHWKGKQRCAKVAKVTPTHQLPKGIIVYSNGNVTCPAGMENSPGKQPSETLILQPPSEIGGRLRVNGALLQVNTSSSTPALLPGSTVTPPQSAPGLRVGEQCVVETPVAAPNLPPSVSYITLQIPTATTALPKQPQAAGSAHTFTLAATSAQQLATESSASPVSTLPTLTQTVTRATASELCSWVTQDTAIRTISYSAVPNSQAILRTGAAGSTQTTWTTLQIAGNTVQPVCQNLSTPEVSNTAQAVQQVTLCPVSNKQSVQPIQIQMQSNVPVQQAPITAHIQAQPFQRPSQLQPAILNQAQPPPVLAPQPQCAVIPQSAIVPQPAVVAHPAVASQPQPTVLQPGSLIPNPATALIPQPQPALVPLLQTMQVLQVNPNGATASGATAPQNTNNPSVVILQQASSCPTQSVVREEITNQTPCQHIVIIQAPNQAAPGPQNPQVGLLPAAVPSAVPVVSTQMSTTSSSTSAASIQSVGGKQLVHILPRPVQPQMNQPLQVTQSSSSPPVPPTPQTITVNGQVFALQPMKTSDKTSSQGGHSTLQLVQPTTTEEPTTNVALNSLGALSSLNQSISQGLPLTISSQNSGQPPAAQLSVVQQQQPLQPPAPVPVSGTTLALPVQQLQVPCLTPVASGLVVNAPKPSRKRVRTNLNMKRAAAKRAKPVKKKELSQLQPAVVVPAKPAVSTGEGPKVQVTVSQGLLSSEGTHTCTTAATTTDNNQAVGNVTSTQNAKKTIVSSSSSETITLSQSHSQSKSLVSACQSNAVFSLNDTGAMATTLTTVNSASVKPPSVSAAVVIQSKPAVISGNNSTVTKVSAPEVKQPTSSTATSTTQTKSAATTAVSRQSRTVVSSAGATDTGYTSITVCTACLTPVCTGSVTTTSPVSLNQVTQPTSVCPPPSSNAKPPAPCNKPQSQPTTSSSVSIPVTLSLSAPTYPEAHSSVTAPPASSEFRKRVGASRAPSQQSDVNMSNPSPCHPTEVKAPQAPRRDRETQEEKHSTAAEKESLVAATSDAPSRKDFALSQQVYTNLDDQTLEHPMTSGRQTDSPMSSGAGGGRGFSVASMLPQGHNISAASGSFGTFTFTSEQAEMLALAMLEQESPGRRSGGCTGDSTASSNPTTGSWEPPKTPPVSTSKERGPTVQQAKVTKPMDTVTVKPAVQVSVRRQVGEGSVNGHNGSRHPQNISYSQSQSHAQVQPQSSSQSGTVASLSVNNLIRPSSSQKPYPGSPSLTGQLGSVPSPVGTSAHISQASNNALSPCSGAAQLNEYTPLKTALMRAQAGAGVAERHVKIISKRQAQDAVMLNTGKRPKPCPPSAPIVTHMDMKAPDHSQMMVGQLLSTSSGVMTRINSESGGPLFSTNSFMSPVVRPTDGHCPPHGPPEQNQLGVLHLPQGHPQHSANQPGQHLGVNLYMKQQQQEQQRHHLYHLQHHLTQPDPAQRALQQQQQQEQQQQQQQHVQKKRGLVRGNQTGSTAGLQQKTHHLEKSGVQQQQQHSHQQQQTQHQQHTQQQHPQQSHQQTQQHQQQPTHQQSHPQQHQQQTLQQQPQAQHQQHQQQQQQLQQQQQSSHSRHQQHLQQQIQQQQHFRHQEKSCDAQAAVARAHHSNHLAQQEHLKPGQDHNAMQRMMSSRTLEQQLISPPSNPVSRSSELACAPSRQERHRVSSYSAEALIGKSSTSGEQQQRMGLHLQPGHGGTQEQPELCGYLDTSRGKANIAHNPQNRLPSDHPGSADVQRVSECPPFKAMGGGGHQLGGFEVQVSRGSDMAPKSVPPSQRGPQGQQQGGFRMNVGPLADSRNRGGYSGAHPGTQGVQVGPPLPREQDGCHQSFMQSLLSPHLPEHSNHQRAVQCCPPVSMEYSCVPGSSSGDIQAKASSPSVPQKASTMRLGEGNKGHLSQVSSNMHGGPGVRAGLPHPPTPHSSSEGGRSSAPSRPPTAISQHSRHITRDTQPAKLRPGDRPRSGALRPSNPFEPDGHLSLPSGGGVLLSRPQAGGEARRSTIVRFMADSGQVPSENNLVPDQHITQNFGFPFIPEGGMNPPPINANSTFIPPVSQSNASRTPSLLPVEPQNTLPSFYPSYSPAAHPSLPSDVTLQYFPNQMFTSPSADKGSAPPLNNRFGSILSPPRPVGFGQASFSLLPDMPPMPIANSSGITPHISNFSLTSLFPEIATGMPTDGSAMPMSPLLSLSNTSSADSGKQPNRPAHNISHILGHDGSSAV